MHLTPELTLGFVSGTMVLAGVRANAAFIEGLCLDYPLGTALLSSGLGVLLLPVGLGMLFRSRLCFNLARIYALIFVAGNTVVIPLEFLRAKSFSVTPAAAIATWIVMVFNLFLIHRTGTRNCLTAQS